MISQQESPPFRDLEIDIRKR